MASHRYNLRSKKYNNINDDNIIMVEAHPSWSYGSSRFNTSKNIIYIKNNSVTKPYECGFNGSSPLCIVKNKLYDLVPLCGTGAIQQDLTLIFVSEVYDMPQNSETCAENEYPCKNFRDVFSGDTTKELKSLCNENKDKIILYYHIGGTHNIPSGCCIC
jgi:hypothetical protein